jgi:hypothetical protein
MQKEIANLITSTAELINPKFQPKCAVTLAFSATGLSALNVTGDLGDAPFAGGQFADATNLVSYASMRWRERIPTWLQGDPGTNNWVTQFKSTNIHGVFLFAR